jgi:acetylornithine deacetylase/succinyl-diaminopimelate desuccinylase-like protein
MKFNRAEVVDLLSKMVEIESVTPWLIESGKGEKAHAEFLRDWLADTNVEVTLDYVQGDRPNLLVRYKGGQPGPVLCINAHADTVGYANWPDRALKPEINGDVMVGLGAADDKAGVVSALLAVKALADNNVQLKGDVLVAAVVDEEGISIGTEHLVANHKMDYAIVIEPTGLPKAITEHQGFGWLDIIVHGKAAHGSAPDAGIDAIVHMAYVITKLHELDEKDWAPNPDPLNGRTVFHTGTIHGGTDYATYPNKVVLGIEIGSQPGETLDNRIKEINDIFTEVKKQFPNFHGEIDVKVNRNPFVGKGFEPLLASMSKASTEIIGKPMETMGENAWTDAALLQEAGVATLLVGPAGGNYHAVDEWVSIPEVVSMTEILYATIVDLLG